MHAVDGQPVLIVENDEDRYRLLESKLTEYGHRVTAAHSGEEALGLARDLAPQLILLKVSLPGMDGFEVCRRLKANHDTRDIPVVFLTVAGEEIDKMNGLHVGGLDYISTPFDDAELLARTTWALRLKQLQDELSVPAEEDKLTGLLNRSFFNVQYHRECNRSRRYDSLFAVVMVDIDRFQQVNSLHGAAFGDLVLKELATILREQTRESDYVARWGSNEFVLMLPEGDLPKAIRFAKKLYGVIAAHEFGPAETKVRLTVSIGVASRQNLGGRDPGELLKLARESLHAAKEQGGDKIVYHTCGEFNTAQL